MALRGIVKGSVLSLARTAAVEAVQADVETGGIVYGVKALRTILSVDGLGGTRRSKFWTSQYYPKPVVQMMVGSSQRIEL